MHARQQKYTHGEWLSHRSKKREIPTNTHAHLDVPRYGHKQLTGFPRMHRTAQLHHRKRLLLVTSSHRSFRSLWKQHSGSGRLQSRGHPTEYHLSSCHRCAQSSICESRRESGAHSSTQTMYFADLQITTIWTPHKQLPGEQWLSRENCKQPSD